MRIKLSLNELKVKSFVTSIKHTENLVSGRPIPDSDDPIELTAINCPQPNTNVPTCPTYEPPGGSANCGTLNFQCGTINQQCGTLSADPKKCMV